jgi:hypothetical protein
VIAIDIDDAVQGHDVRQPEACRHERSAEPQVLVIGIEAEVAEAAVEV